jgi:hypothetical protein
MSGNGDNTDQMDDATGPAPGESPPGEGGGAPPPPPERPGSNSPDSRLYGVKKTVERLLNYAVSNPGVVIPEKLLKQAIEVLRKPIEDFTEGDEYSLWDTYGQLSKLVKPASDLSIQIAQQLSETNVLDKEKPPGFWELIKFWERDRDMVSPAVIQCIGELRTILMFLVLSVGVYVVIQGHCALLSDALTSSSKSLDQWKIQRSSLSVLGLASLKENPSVASQLDEVKGNLHLIVHELAASSQALVDLTKPLVLGNFSLLSASTIAILRSCEDNNRHIQLIEEKTHARQPAPFAASDTPQPPPATVDGAPPPVPPAGPGALRNSAATNLMACIAFEREYATSLYTILSRYILPLVLGVVGATAYVVRRTLYQLETNSYLPATKGRLLMRLCLGGLLGAISGIFLSTDQKEIEGFNLSLILVALLMGYSVEVAFSLFDSVIERMRSWTGSLRTRTVSADHQSQPPSA